MVTVDKAAFRVGRQSCRVLLFVCYMLPLYVLVATSLKGSNVRIYKHAAALVFKPTIEAYQHIVSNGQLFHGIGNSAIVAVATTALTLLLGAPAAYGLAKARGRWLISFGIGLLVALQMVPQTAAIIPLYQILGRWGLLDTYWGVILADTAFFLPFSILIMRPFMQSVPNEIEEAALIDGASRGAIFVRVVLPLAKNGLVTTATLVFILAWGEFIYAISILNTPAKYPISAMISQQISAYGVGWSSLMALSVMGALPVLVIYVFGQKHLAQGLTLGAVK